ncbi:hypothetical protein B0O99DRAFT_402593 [Bisporella sp. PMI_857]|jgi:hypothetical protein|nr:hypothetical protein B0O99DRAFT_402593 [Bisporella sp. PMI_857]
MSKIPRWTQRETNLNNADNIERYLQEDGHRTWGFVIYRCTYDSDDDWNKFMEHLQHHIRQALEVYNGLDMMDSLGLTVIEDRSILDDASTSFVREHFKQWTTTAPEQEQGEGIGPSLSQRYRYCIQVDDAALESIIEDENDGFINLIQKDWEPHTPGVREPVEDPIEDCTLHDVGWMMVAYQDVMVDMYYQLRGYNNWYTEYRRPPKVARG